MQHTLTIPIHISSQTNIFLLQLQHNHNSQQFILNESIISLILTRNNSPKVLTQKLYSFQQV